MSDFHDFKGTARRLTASDIMLAARGIGVTYASLRAILEVESAGGGFDKLGRPKILFEPLHFYRNLHKLEVDQPTIGRAVTAGLATPGMPPRDFYSKPPYERLKAALEFDERAALLSCSWGIGQVLGESYALGGFSDVQAMVFACMEDEAAQLALMCGFLKARGVVAPMNARDWAKVAKLYNGSAYAKFSYDRKLAAAFAKWSAAPLPALPYTASGALPAVLAPTGDGPLSERMAGLAPALPPQPATFVVKAAQERLMALHYFGVGKADGLMGKRTSAAIVAFQIDNGLPKTGELDEQTMDTLATAGVAKIDPERASVTIKDLRPDSVTIQKTDTIKRTSVLQGLGGIAAVAAGSVGNTLSGSAGYASDAYNWVVQAKQAFGDLPLWAYGVAIVVLSVVMYWYARETQVKRLQDERMGKITTIPAGVHLEPPTQVGSPALDDTEAK